MKSELMSLYARLSSLESRLNGSDDNDSWMYQHNEDEDELYTQDSMLMASFVCTGTGALTFTVATGSVYIAGVSKTITDFPVGNVTVSSPSAHKWYGYIEVDLENSTATWKTSSTDPGDGTDTKEIWPIVDITTNTDDSAIAELKQRWLGDIHITRTA